MVYRIELLCRLMCFLADMLHVFKKYLSMALRSNSPGHASLHQPPPWKILPKPAAAAAVDNCTPEHDNASCAEFEGPVVCFPTPKYRSNEKHAQEAIRSISSTATATATATGSRAKENKPRVEPLRITVPILEFSNYASFGLPENVAMEKNGSDQEYVTLLESDGYSLASRRGRRRHAAMEDGHDIITCINGDPKQAFFGVFDGHGGRAAVDFVSGKLGKNILAALHELGKEDSQGQPEMAIRKGYLTTDREFLSQGVGSGVCAATVLLKDGDLHVANVGDCKVVMSREGLADALTNEHRPGREDERIRIANSGGFVSCHNGTWRVHDSLAISRAFGNESMKELIICEPEMRKIHLTPDCEFLIMASDGLWDKVSNQEAVDVVVKHKTTIDSCKELVDISCNRGNRDDITVMIIKLETFIQIET